MRASLFFAGSIILLFQTSCTSEHKEEEHGTTFTVTSPLLVDTLISREYVSQIHSIQHIELRALERGYLEGIFVDEGQHVKEGQSLFKIRPVLYLAEVSRAEAEADFAQIEYQNTKALADSNVVSPNELALAKARLDKARAELSMAQAHLGFTDIKAPFDGIIGRFHVRKGSLLDEGDLLTELSDNRPMWVYFNVPEAEYLKYKRNSEADNGSKVRLKMANGETFDQGGVITAIESDFDNTTGNIAFRATFSNPDMLLRHGETGSILMDSELDNVLVIPQKATFEILDHRYVFVIGEDSVVKSRPITVAQELQHLFVVSEGLKETDHILLEGLRKVKELDHIDFRTVPADSVIKHLDLYAE